MANLDRCGEYGPNRAGECEYGACLDTATHSVCWRPDGTVMLPAPMGTGHGEYCERHALAVSAVHTVRYGERVS